jgi:hypothetical protein
VTVRPAHLLVLAAPFVFYLIPFLAGYGWSALSPMTPGFPGMVVPARQSEIPTAVEHYGTGVVTVPFQARLRAYLRDGDLPLWNPYSGLGQPFAAQGEGSPYFPPAVLRSLLPTSWSNLVTFAVIGVSTVTLFLFLRLLGLSAGAAAFGGAAWALAGQFTLNLARNNYVDQFAMIPPLFLAAAWAIESRRALAYVVFALVVALHAVAGLLQIGVNTLLLLSGFLLFFGYLRGTSLRGRLTTILASFVFLGLGTAIAAPYVLPIVEGVRAAYNKNVPYLAFLPMPAANLYAFFSPLLFGQIFQSWIAGRYPDVADWNNLYAHGSIGLFLLAIFACVTLPRARREQRLTFLFFLCGLIFFHTRYMSVPPGSLVSYLPILSQQSPKHTNGVAVFCLVVVAGFGVEWLRRVNWRYAGVLVLAALLGVAGFTVYLVRRQSALEVHNWSTEAVIQGLPLVLNQTMAATYLGLTLVIGVILLVALWLAHRASTDAGAALIATAAVIGESSVYLLLGNDDPGVLAVRVVICALVVVAGVLAARRLAVPATVAGLLAVGAYAWVVIAPSAGLPERLEVDAPPRYMAWLRQAAGHEYRSFGIFPDYSSIGEIQDVEVVGPIATNAWVAFVDLVSSPPVARVFRVGSTFSLIQQQEGPNPYDLTADYPRARPLLDWAGVRFLVLDKAVFGGRRTDHRALLESSSGLRVAYEDEVVTILESPTARPKAYFTSNVREESAATTLARLQADPRAVEDLITVEEDVGDVARGRGGPSVPVPLAEFRPNGLRATFEAPAPGIFVVTDSYFPGWQATVNGQPAEVIQVNGLVRGVVVPAAGRQEVTMSYRPASFVNGMSVALTTVLLLLALLTWDLLSASRRRSAQIASLEPAPAT